MTAEAFEVGQRVAYVAMRKSSSPPKWRGTVIDVEPKDGFSIIWCKPDHGFEKIGCAPDNLRLLLEQQS